MANSVKLDRMSEILCFEDLRKGDRWTSPARTITEADIVNFACHTGDFDPLHVDHEFAKQSMYRRPIAHGLLGLSFLAGLSSRSPAMCNLAFVGIRDWHFVRPLYVGDTVSVVEELQPQGRRSGRVLWRRQLLNQDAAVVQEGILETLVATRAGQIRLDSSEKKQAPSGNVGKNDPLVTRGSPSNEKLR